MKCLLVDDEPGIREGLAVLLRRQGHDVQTAADCEAAAAAVLAQPFDVVITDWRLPDGTAARFVGHCPCPVVAVSGHPEEVERLPAVHSVLTKPVAPSRLLEAMAMAVHSPAAIASDALPLDVQRVVDAVRARLPSAAVVELHDDGTFVLLRAEPLDDASVLAFETLVHETLVHEAPGLAAPGLEAQGRQTSGPRVLGGDLRILSRNGSPRLELRLCRDGRPDLDVPVARPDACWPETAELAIDFHGLEVSSAQLGCLLDRAAALAAMGRRVHFMNVPDRLRSLATDQGRAHDMPMRGPVGPRLPAVFADLWSQP